ncbi:hypothetical protein, partial [Brachyspira hampsonii]
DELCRHYIQTKLAILEMILNRIAEEYPDLNNSMVIKRNRLEINSDLCGCYIDIDDGLFKICFDGKAPYCYEESESLILDIGEQISENE